MRLQVFLVVLVPHKAGSGSPRPLTRHSPTVPLGCFVSEPPLDSCEVGAPAGALALSPQTFSGYTGTNLLPGPQPHRLSGRTGHLQAAGPGLECRALVSEGSARVREDPESISCERGWVLG